MKRLNNQELDARINNFMKRKMQEYPDLEPVDAFIANTGAAKPDHTDTFHSITNRFGFHWHNTPHTA